MTLADQAVITGHDGEVTSGKPERPKRRTFTAAYKARILGEFDALSEGSPERGGADSTQVVWRNCLVISQRIACPLHQGRGGG